MQLDRETAKERIKEQISCVEFLEKTRNGGPNSYCCPFPGCETGRHDKKTGGVKIWDRDAPDKRGFKEFKCFACGKSGDVIKAYQLKTGADYFAAISQLAARIGITISEDRKPAQTVRAKTTGKAEKTEADKMQKTEQAPTEPRADYTGYYEKCRERLEDPAALAYLEKRGISIETAKKYGLGFDPAADPANAPGGSGRVLFPCPRLIIPTSPDHYVGRQTSGEEKFPKLNPKGGHTGFFNLEALKKPGPVFVVEGVFDAMSIDEAGGEVISLNSTSNARAFIEILEKERPAAFPVLCMDNDQPGKNATAILQAGLDRLKIPYLLATDDICGDQKDANDVWREDRDIFIKIVAAIKARAEELAAAAPEDPETPAAEDPQAPEPEEDPRPDNTDRYIDAFFDRDIEKFKDTGVKTGFDPLDNKIGALYPGLYALAAGTSCGKTTFALQLADQIARDGTDVLFFSLEQSRFELVSKSLARIIYESPERTKIDSLDIRKGSRRDLVDQAILKYKKDIGDRISIIEGNFKTDVDYICRYIEAYVKRNPGRRPPVVFIDYLQILQAEIEASQTVRKQIDNYVTQFKRLTRDLNMTMFIISSLNRSAYYKPFGGDGLKESGGIEYTCDVVWGLQFDCCREKMFRNKETSDMAKDDRISRAAQETPRQMNLVCVKNRYGEKNWNFYCQYNSKYDYFNVIYEIKPPATEAPEAEKKANPESEESYIPAEYLRIRESRRK